MPHAIYVLEEPKTLSVIVPAYNEAGSIAETIRNIEEALSRYEFGHELIIVDDGSTDETFDRASSVAKTITGVRVLSYRDNNGKGHALKHGFQSAFQTFGLRDKTYAPLIEWVGAIFWLLLPLAFASMPIYFLMNK